MTPFRRLLTSRRLLAVAGLAIALFGLAMLDPYPRQSLFGPTIRGKPWCYWENAIRRHGERPNSWLDRLQRWIGVSGHALKLEEFDDAELLPVVVAMLDDPDPLVRNICMIAIIQFPALQDRSALPALRKWLREDELPLRFAAAEAIWRIEKDPEVIRWLKTQLDQNDPETRKYAVGTLGNLASEMPEVYAPIVAHAKDADPLVRQYAMYGVTAFGAKGVPILIDGTKDVDPSVRYAALLMLEHLRPKAHAARSAIEARLQDRDGNVAYQAKLALRAIDRMED